MTSKFDESPANYVVAIQNSQEFNCKEDERVLYAMIRAGKKKIPIGCRQGGCGVCRIRIVEGNVERLKMGKNHVSDQDAELGFALACRIFPKSDLLIQLEPKLEEKLKTKEREKHVK